MDEDQLSYQIIGVALELPRNIGPGLLEPTYESALAKDLRNLGVDVSNKQAPMPFVFKEVKMDVGYRLNLLIEHKVLVKVK